MRRPICAFESVSQRGSTIGCDRVNAAVGTSGRFVVSAGPEKSQALEFLERVVNLRARDSCPVAYLTALQHQVCLVAMHWALGDPAQPAQLPSRPGTLPFTPSPPRPF